MATLSLAMVAASGAQVPQSHPSGVFHDSRQTAAVAPPTRPSVDRLERVSIIDGSGFGQPMAAMTLEVPVGWLARGGVEWNRQLECTLNAYQLHWSAASADGLHEVSALPRLSWQLESAGLVPTNPCPGAPFSDARQYLEHIARNARPGARVLSYRQRPDLVEQMRQGAAQQTSPNGARMSWDAGELLIGYALQGREMRESMVAAVSRSEMQGSVSMWAETGLALRAPDGQLDFALLERIRSSARYDKAWMEQVTAWAMDTMRRYFANQAANIQQWHARRMSEINAAGMAARHQIRMETIADIGRINQQTVARRSAVDDRIHARNLDAIQEVQPWRDPDSGRQIDLSIHYKHAWQLEDGRQFLTNDSQFEPGRDLGIRGRRLEPVR
jgi:hypothetical protein